MKSFRYHKKELGQALIELITILPILILFISVTIPIIEKGVSLLWLDERLTIRHFIHDSEMIHPLLLSTHESDQLPNYFNSTAVKDTTRNVSVDMPLNISHITFPGALIIKTTTTVFPDDRSWNSLLNHDTQKHNRQISKNLAMVKTSLLSETQAAEKVKKLTLIGFTSRITNVLEKAGINFFHLNLNALPISEERGEVK